MKIGISPYHERLATLGPMNDRPMEMMKKIGTIMLRSVVNLISVFVMFLSIMLLFRLAYHHVIVRNMPAAAWSIAYNITDSCRLGYWSRILVKKGVRRSRGERTGLTFLEPCWSRVYAQRFGCVRSTILQQ